MSWSKTLKHGNKRWTIPAFGEQNVIHTSPVSLEETRPRREMSMKRSFNAFHNFEVGQQGKKNWPRISLDLKSVNVVIPAAYRCWQPETFFQLTSVEILKLELLWKGTVENLILQRYQTRDCSPVSQWAWRRGRDWWRRGEWWKLAPQ